MCIWQIKSPESRFRKINIIYIYYFPHLIKKTAMKDCTQICILFFCIHLEFEDKKKSEPEN